MIKRTLKLLYSLLLFNSSFCLAANETAIPSLAPVLKNAMPAIVNVAVQGFLPMRHTLLVLQAMTKKRRITNSSQANYQKKVRKFESIGSGVILDPKNGMIITNDHVIRNANLITITLQDGRRLKAKFIGGDSETDMAILKIDAKNLKSLAIGDSDQRRSW